MTVLGTGLSGLVGSKFVDTYKDRLQFVNLDLTNGVDILNDAQVVEAFEKSDAPIVVHFAAYTDTQKAFEQQGDKEGPAYKVNVIGTQNIARAAARTDKHLIHISTAYVFDGNKEGLYTENDPMNPIEWYGQTKAWAEEEVAKHAHRHTILRIDRPYRMDDFARLDILHKVKTKLEAGELPPQFADTSWTPTSIEKFCEILYQMCDLMPQGVYHATTEQVFSDYTFALWIKQYFQIPRAVTKGSLTQYLKSNPRPYQRNTALDTTKFRSLMS